MADIDVERRRTSVWAWVFGLLVAALLIWGLAEAFGGNEEAEEEVPIDAVGTRPASPSPVAAGLRIA